MSRELEITYIKRGQLIPSDGEYIPMPDYCHHGRYVSGMVVREIGGSNEFGPRCPFCGIPDYQTHDVAGHVETLCCNQTVSTCCPGAGEGESG